MTPHPATPSGAVDAIDVTLSRSSGGVLELRYTLKGELHRVRIPEPRRPLFADELWRHTCFEVFVRDQSSEAYHEFNFSPSGEWAAYAFSGYRQGMRSPEDFPRPQIALRREARALTLEAGVEIGSAPAQLALSAVVEDTDGTVSYWALTHPSARPDFHHPDAFALHLP